MTPKELQISTTILALSQVLSDPVPIPVGHLGSPIARMVNFKFKKKWKKLDFYIFYRILQLSGWLYR